MMTDILNVTWKELREILIFSDPRGRSKISLLIMIGVFGILIPLQNGRAWVESPISAIAWGWMPFLMVSNVVADSFAGERERHTLESLLATRLSDRAILFGKLLAALLYGFTLTWIMLLLSLVTVNLVFGHGQLLLFSAVMLLAMFIFSLLISGLAASAGVLVSLRAASVRQAQQTLSLSMFLLFVPFLILGFLPSATVERVGQSLQNINFSLVVVWIAVGIFLLDLGLTLIALKRFQRSKLILD
jgi:ABC-2 type transport system permease protein